MPYLNLVADHIQFSSKCHPNSKNMSNESNLLFSKDHVWIKEHEKNKFYLGISNFAQETLGDIVFVDVKNGIEVSKNNALGVIESVKTASDIVCPEDGVIISINDNLSSNPELINEKPHETWICEIEFSEEVVPKNYLNLEDYEDLVKI
jgi:glycine cleavage system H protein